MSVVDCYIDEINEIMGKYNFIGVNGYNEIKKESYANDAYEECRYYFKDMTVEDRQAILENWIGLVTASIQFNLIL